MRQCQLRKKADNQTKCELQKRCNGQMGSTNDQRNYSEEKVKKIMDSEESKRL